MQWFRESAQYPAVGFWPFRYHTVTYKPIHTAIIRQTTQIMLQKALAQNLHKPSCKVGEKLRKEKLQILWICYFGNQSADNRIDLHTATGGNTMPPVFFIWLKPTQSHSYSICIRFPIRLGLIVQANGDRNRKPSEQSEQERSLSPEAQKGNLFGNHCWTPHNSKKSHWILFASEQMKAYAQPTKIIPAIAWK